MLLVEQLIVFVHLHLHAVGEIRVAVVLLKLGVLQAQIHIAVDSGNPAQNGVVVDGRMDKALRDGQVGGGGIDILPFVLMGDALAVLRLGAIEIAPAVAALSAEVGLVVGVVVRACAGIGHCRRLCRRVRNGDVQAAAVKGVVVPGIHHEVEALPLLDGQLIHENLRQILRSRADVHVFQLQQLLAMVDQKLNAVRIAGVGVPVHILDVGEGHVHCPILRNPPFQNGRGRLGGVEEVLFDLQSVGAGLEILLPVKLGDLLGAVGALGVAVAVEPAVFPLLAEILHVKGVVGAAGLVLKGGLLVDLCGKGAGPEGRNLLQLNGDRLLPLLRGGSLSPCAVQHGKCTACRHSHSAQCSNQLHLQRHACHAH